MTSTVKDDLPSVIPDREIRVTETHEIESYEISTGTAIEQQYTLNKAPVYKVEQLLATVNGSEVLLDQGTDFELTELVRDLTQEFEYDSGKQDYFLDFKPDSGSTTVTDDAGKTYVEGTDYDVVDVRTDTDEDEETIRWLQSGDNPHSTQLFDVDYTVTFDNSVINFSIGGKTPDENSKFHVTVVTPSVIGRYADAHDDEIHSIEHSLEEVVEGKFIDNATGSQLDELGALFGEIGKRRGRNDQRYRFHLKSIVESFSGRGTLDGIRFAVTSGIGVDEGRVVIEEEFDRTLYRIQVKDWPRVDSDIITALAELADPSGVKQGFTQFFSDEHVIFIDYSSVNITDLGQLGDFFGLDDFDGQGSFGGSDSNNVFNTSTSTTGVVNVTLDPSNNNTEIEGFGQSAFGAGAFDGQGDDPDVEGTTTSPASFTIVTASPSTAETILEGFGGGSFDGSSSFGANNDTDDSGTTTSLTSAVTTSYSPSTDQTLIEGFGTSSFGAGSLDGQADRTDVSGETTAETSTTVIVADPTSSQQILEGFGGDLFDGQGAFGSGDSNTVSGTTTTLTASVFASYSSVTNQTLIQGFGDSAFGSGSFDGLADSTDTSGTSTFLTAALIATYSNQTNSTIDADGFGSDSFDGSGIFN